LRNLKIGFWKKLIVKLILGLERVRERESSRQEGKFRSTGAGHMKFFYG